MTEAWASVGVWAVGFVVGTASRGCDGSTASSVRRASPLSTRPWTTERLMSSCSVRCTTSALPLTDSRYSYSSRWRGAREKT